MRWTEMPRDSANHETWRLSDWAAGFFLFWATAGVVFWQNSRLAVLWDLSYVLENSWRISAGDFPYRDFPFPYAPLTFLTQSLLIRLTGRVFFHHVVYCAILAGLGTILTWRILTHLLHGAVSSSRLVAFLLALPLAVVGIYGVFPHAFYDPDCTFVILLCIFLLLQIERKDFSPVRAFGTGMLFVVPLFVKQNTGAAFLASAGLAVVCLTVQRAWRKQSSANYLFLIAGIAAGLLSAFIAVHFTVGVHNYERWTVQFAAARRLPSLSVMFAPYWNFLLPIWIVSFAGGVFLLGRTPKKRKWPLRALSISLLSLPFAWPLFYLFIDPDPSDRAEILLALWPFLMIVSLAIAAWNPGRNTCVSRNLPFILIATVQGAFLSQQLWGSTYAIWPLLILLLAGIIVALSRRLKDGSPGGVTFFAGVASLSILVCSGFYVASHERLNYADVSNGELNRSTLPALAGLSMRGPWLSQFEELVRYSDREIPRDQGLLMIPGEDLFYYTTGRRPRFPVLMFDRTVNPYSPEEIVDLARQRNICWLVIKKRLQLDGQPVEDKARLLNLLSADFTAERSLANYDIYQRKPDRACPVSPSPLHPDR